MCLMLCAAHFLNLCCSEIEAKTRGALGATDINDMYDKEAVTVDAETEDTESDEALPLEV